MAFDKAGGAQRPVGEQLPPPVPRPKQAPTSPVAQPRHVHPRNRKAGEA